MGDVCLMQSVDFLGEWLYVDLYIFVDVMLYDGLV